MKKVLIVVAVLIGIGLAYWLGSPLFINREVSETVEELVEKMEKVQLTVKTISQGSFVGLDFHNAEGTAKLLEISGQKFIRFDDDFKVTNGPDLFVYLGKDGKYDPATKLGVLKGNIGSQNYEIPADVDLTQYDEVWVWCRAFSVPFGKAVLK